MADGLEITISGLPELDSILTDIGEGDAVEKVCRKALRAGGNVMKAAIAANAPVRPDLPSGTALPVGALQTDIQVNVTRDSADSYSAWVSPGKETRHVALWVEWGHRLVRGGRLGSKRKGGQVVGDVRAHPYIRPAFDANDQIAFEAVGESLASDINLIANNPGAVQIEDHGIGGFDDGGGIV